MRSWNPREARRSTLWARSVFCRTSQTLEAPVQSVQAQTLHEDLKNVASGHISDIHSDRRFSSSMREPFAYMREPLGVLDLRSCTVTSFAVRLLSEMVGETGRAKTEVTAGKQTITNKLSFGFDDELCDGLRAKQLFLAIPTASNRC